MTQTIPSPLFLQIHTLTSFPGALLNRDDQGFAKRLPFGGVTRTRVSSQCLKRHWRMFQGEHSLATIETDEGVDLSIRSRETFERLVVQPLIKEGIKPELARTATEAVMVQVLGESAKAKKAKVDSKAESDGKDAALHTGQITVLGRPEIDFFLQEARALAQEAEDPLKVDDAKKKRFTKEWGKNLAGLKRAAGLDAALFGRMVTSSKLARADAAIHVAHAFTVHAEQAETDYFSAMDDLAGADEAEQLGSGHIGTTELTSGLFYGYVAVDVAQLVSNVEGCKAKDWRTADRKLSAEVVARLVQLVARVSPGAKLGSTAPHAFAHLTLVEAGSSQPCTLANAFLKPVSATPDLLANTYGALVQHVSELDALYELNNRRAFAAIRAEELSGLGQGKSLKDVSAFAANALLEHG